MTDRFRIRLVCSVTASVLALSQIAACGGSSAAEAPGGQTPSQPSQSTPLPPQANVPTGPLHSGFWESLPEVPLGAQRGDILHINARTDAPEGSRGVNIIYVSEAADGGLAYVSGMIFYPTAPTTQPRRVMLWNHETSGSGDACAPSRNIIQWGNIERLRGLSGYLKAGYVVVASDYQGLGTPGETVYMQGKPQAKASLDIVFAAQRLADTQAGTRVAMAGWSQGGQTSVWAANIAPSYAPSLDIVGGILLAPAARTLELVEYEASNQAYGAYYMAIHAGMQAGNPQLKLKDVIAPEGLELLPHLAYDCWSLWSKVEQEKPIVARLEGLAPGTSWRAAHEANQAFLPVPAKSPMLIVQGSTDKDVPRDMTRKLAKDLCATGTPTVLHEIPGGHSAPMMTDYAPEIAWVNERFSGLPVAGSCSLPQ